MGRNAFKTIIFIRTKYQVKFKECIINLEQAIIIKNIMFEKKYLKYKKKYIEIKHKQFGGVPSFEELDIFSVVNHIKALAHKEAYSLLETVSDINRTLNEDADIKKDIQIATAESLTGGLLFSTLVDIPYWGAHKYGCFGVYDTDAKRVFINVTEGDVYTHKCVKEMAIGILLNSHATVGIAVSGNAMPRLGHEMNLGEVFIGIATYVNGTGNSPYKIKVKTSMHNFCEDDTCKLWVNTPKIRQRLAAYIETLSVKIDDEDMKKHIENKYNSFQITSIVSQIIRNYTVASACKLTKEFLLENKELLMIPDFITEKKINNWKPAPGITPDENGDILHLVSQISLTTPNNSITAQYIDLSRIEIECDNSVCDDVLQKHPFGTGT